MEFNRRKKSTDLLIDSNYDLSPKSISRIIFNYRTLIYTDTPNKYLSDINLVQYIMYYYTLDEVNELFRILHLNYNNMEVDTRYNLLWYLNNTVVPIKSDLKPNDIFTISSYSVDELLEILGPNYDGATDHASLMFALLTRATVKLKETYDKSTYDTIKRYSPKSVWDLCIYKYNKNQLKTIVPPYIILASTFEKETLADKIIIYCSNHDFVPVMKHYGIISPDPNINSNRNMLYKYFITEMSNYDEILNRPPNTPYPYPLNKLLNELLTQDDDRFLDYYLLIKQQLEIYTLEEIVKAYEPKVPWTDRKKLLNNIIKSYLGDPVWSFRNKWCNNDDTYNIISMELHGNENKDDPNNPTLSYGYPRTYRCYQVDELEANFREVDGFFIFGVPDWRDNVIDDMTGEKMQKSFAKDSILQLRTVLKENPQYQTYGLLNKIDYGLKILKNQDQIMDILKDKYNKLDNTEKYLFNLFIVWLFTYAMWMRRWNGPGYPWPVSNAVINKNKEQFCERGDNIEHLFIQQGVHDALNDNFNAYPNLNNLIESIPIINYNFETKEKQIYTSQNTLLSNILRLIEHGSFCVAHASDLLLGTAYNIMRTVLGRNNIQQINELIAEIIPYISNIEQQVVNNLLTDREGLGLTQSKKRKSILEKRRDELLKPIEMLPFFDPETVDDTGHTDPQHGEEFNIEHIEHIIHEW